uniref:Uncharacterized protein n=1 Tax=Plectus sambesii TaxID=2011161 RepID=A0A914VPI2_9BILA
MLRESPEWVCSDIGAQSRSSVGVKRTGGGGGGVGIASSCNGRVVTDDSEATRPSLSNDVPPAPTIAPTNGCDSSSSGDSTTSGSLRARQAKRPKSYIMATNCVAADDDDAATAVGHQRRAVADDRSDKRVASAFAAAVASSPSPQLARTNAPHPPAAHRIQKFITFFSTHEAQVSSAHSNSPRSTPPATIAYCPQPSKAPGPLAIVNVQGRGGGGGNKSSQLKKHKSDGVQRARPQPIPVRAADVLKQGQLVHRQVPFANTTALPLPAANASANTAVAAADARQRLWDQCWAVLHESTLYLCRQLSSYTSEHTGDKVSKRSEHHE